MIIKQRQENKDSYCRLIPKKESYGKERPVADVDQKEAKQRKHH